MAILTGRGTTFAIASDDEAFSGADVNKAITPDQLMSVVSRGLETVTGGLTYQGVFDANDLSPDLSNARQGDFYKISVAGTAYGATYAVGDMLLVNADMGGTITNGKIDKVDSSESLTNLDDLIDVTVSNAINGEVLQYLNGEWVNRPSAGATTLNDLSDVTLGTLSGGDVLKYNGTNWVDDTLATSDISGLGSIATQDANNVSITGGSIAGITDLAIADGGTGASTAAAARTNLELEIGVDVQAFNDRLTDIAGLTPNDNSIIVGNGSNFVLETGATAQASLGLGSIATQDANSVSITGGSIAGITDLAIADGGTGASTAAAARTNLELEIGVDVQAFNDRLTDIAGLTPNDNSIIVGNGSNFVLETGATAQASLGLGTAATKDFGENAGNLVELDGNGKLPQIDGSQLTNLPSGVTTLDGLSDVTLGTLSGGDVLKYNGTNWVDDTLATSDISGLGSIATQDANSVSITGGSIAGITDLAIADGGTGASTAAAARTNLGLGSIATQDANNVSITGGSIAGITDLAIADGGTGASTASGARTNLGLGSIATQDANNVSITGGSIAGITDLAIADGGTGASTASGARTSLGLGTAATKDFGENAGNLVELDENGKLPEIDGSQLTNLPSGGGLTYSVVSLTNYTASANTHAHYTPGSSNTWNVTLPATSGLSSGDVFAFSRTYNGTTIINKNAADGNCVVGVKTGSVAASVTIDSQPSVFYFIFDGTNFRQAQVGLGSGAELDADNSANNLVKLDGQGRLPQIDGSQLTNLPYVPTEIRTAGGSALNLSASLTNLVYWLTPTTNATFTITLPLTSTLTDGDSWTVQRQTAGNLVIQQHGNEAANTTRLRFGSTDATSHTINAPGQSFLITFDADSANGGKFFIFDQVFLQEISTDTTPQLGGDLDVNGNVITSASNGVVEITPDGTGTVNLGGNTNSATLKFYDDDNSNFVALKAPATASLTANVTFTLPVEDGSQDQVLKTDGSGQLGWATAASGGASDLDGLSDVTITNPAGQQVLRHNGTNFVNAQLAYSDLTGTPTVPSSSDDLTSDHTGVNYTGATTDSLTTHLAGIDSALATAGGGATLAVQSNTSYTLAASDAEGIHIWYGADNTSTFTVTMPDIADVLSSNVSSNGDPGATFEVYVGRGRAGDITISAADGIDILGDGTVSYSTTQTVDAGEWIKLIAWRVSASTQRYLMDGASQPRDAALDSISGLTTSANQLIYTTGSDTYATASLTAAGRALLDDADAAAQRATLGAIGEVSDDTTPQLGGDLDLNGNDIVTTSNATLGLAPNGNGFVEVKGNNNAGAIRLNCEQNSHGVTLQGPDHSATATYTLTLPTSIGASNQVLKATNNAGQLGWADPAGLTVVEVASSTTSVSATPSNFYIVETTSGNTTNVTLPQLPGNYSVGDRVKVFHHGDGVLRIRENSSGTTLDPNDASSLNQTERSINPRSIVEIVLTGSGGTPSQYEYAISPQIEFEPDSDNQVLYYDATNLSMKPLGYTFPTADGSANQVLQTDGSGALSFQTLSSGGGGPTYSAITANTTAQADYHYSCTGTITLTLPTSGISAGAQVRVKNMGTGTITIDPQTRTIDGSSTDRILNDQYQALILISTGTNWEII